MNKPVILVTGANGQLGKELRVLAPQYNQFEFVFLSREDLKIHHFELVRNYFKTIRPAYCINCAAYTAVDRAEEEKELAYQVNAEAVGVLAAICREYNTRFIHISTDYVFEGNGHHPYKEEDPVNPQSVYGASKLKGEQEAITYNDQVIILRTSWVYSRFGKNFVKTMIRLMRERKEISVVNDQVGSPTYAADLAGAILQIISSGKWAPGIYHFSNHGSVSWYGFAMAIKEMIHSNSDIHPIPTSAYPTPAKRPAWSVMDNSRIQETWNITAKDWKESLAACIPLLD